MGLSNLHLVCQVRGEGRSVRVGCARSLRPSGRNTRMVLLDSDAFLTHFSRILEKSRGTGTVQITMKRCAPAGPANTLCLLRTLSAAAHAARSDQS